MDLIRGAFYEFHPERVISRAGQPLQTRAGMEIGPVISNENALRYVKSGKNVYTLNGDDAYRLALQVTSNKPVREIPHHPSQPSPTGRMDVYFRHYHPGGDHDQFGHIFFGQRGDRYIPRRISA